MELINHTPLAATLSCTDVPTRSGGRTRLGVVTAKATFDVDLAGQVALQTEDPLPILEEEAPIGPLGWLPRDTVVRGPNDHGIDVMVVGHATSLANRNHEVSEVALRIGDVELAIRVVGDRQWVSSGDDMVLTEPTPWTRIPMSWYRAFGGTSEVELDAHTQVPVSEPSNRHGRGFDADAYARGLADSPAVAHGYPRVVTPRSAPNLELLDGSFGEATDPACWAPMPLDLGVRVLAAEPPGMSFSHPRLTRLNLGPGEEIQLDGHSLERMAFRLPHIKVHADYELGNRSGTLALRPTQLILLSDERSFTVSLQAGFRFEKPPTSAPRSIRLRVDS